MIIRKMVEGAGIVILAVIILAAGGCSDDVQKDLEQFQEAVEDLHESLERPSPTETTTGPMEAAIIESPGEYPPGWYAGPVDKKYGPERDELVIGMSYEVVDIISSFQRWDEDAGNWVAVGQTTGPLGKEDYKSPPEPPGTGLYLGSKYDPMRGPGKYELIINGTIRHYVVEEAQTVSRGPVPRVTHREEVYEVVPFTITGETR